MKKLFAVVFLVIGMAFGVTSFSYAEPHFTYSKQYKKCTDQLSEVDRLACYENESQRLIAAVRSDVVQFKNILSIPDDVKDTIINHYNAWIKYEETLTQTELLTAQQIGGMSLVMGILAQKNDRILEKANWFADTMEDIGMYYVDDPDDVE